MRTLVAVDLSPASDEALRQAALMRTGAGAALAVCHVIPNLQTARPLFPQMLVHDADFLLKLPEKAAEAVRGRVEEASGLAPESYELFIDQGVDYAEIVRRAESWKADRIVIGAHGTGGLRFLLGGVAERVIRHAPCSVMCARAAHSDADEKAPVIAATDLSDPSVPAIEHGVIEAQRRGAPLIITHAHDFADSAWASIALSPLIAPSLVPSSVIEGAAELARAVISQHLERLKAKAEIVILDGSAAGAIARLADARKAGLVVVGTHGRTGLAHLALGSVAERIFRAAPCSVLAVRQK